MSFQGDVGGIGLAELLQSLTRGRREGVLRLHAKNGLTCTLGLSDGVVIFLPDEDEDPQIWRDRVRQAWINDFDERLIAMRMSEVAKAHRIERVFSILDSDGAHFRFQPGEIPSGPTGPVTSGSEDPGAGRLGEVYCEGMPVEFLLLEYARMSDETEGAGDRLGFSNFVVPRTLDPGGAEEKQIRFLQECDGASTLAEVGDRLGWPIRQVRLVFLEHWGRGEVRLAECREMLALAQHELSQGHVMRASARLTGWIQASAPGALDEGDAELLAAEFRADRMGPLINLMPAKEMRILLRRMDHALGDAEGEVKRWRELGRLKRSDAIAEVHRLGAEFRWEEDEEVPSLRDLLDAARRLREDGSPARAAAFLRMAASQEPENASARLDIGLGMLHADMIEEAAAWILDACQTLIAAGHAEKAVTPLRTLLDTDGSIREARRMLGRLKHLTVRKQLIRKNSAIGFAIVAILGTTAWVRISQEQSRELKLAEIAGKIDEPAAAQALLEAYFPEDGSTRVEELREVIHDRRKFIENESRNDWYEAYREAQLACSLGEPAEGLERALELPPPPILTTVEEPWPLLSDLFNGLAARLENDLETLGPVDLDDPRQVEREKELSAVVQEVADVLAPLEDADRTGDLPKRVEALGLELAQRVRDRVERIDARDRENLLERQDLMLAAARSHDLVGELGKSIEVYENLIATDESGRLQEILAEELTDVRRRHAGLARARELAGSGDHEAALAVLDVEFEAPDELPLPWTLEAFPESTLVSLADGSTRSLPFVFESRRGEEVEFVLEAPGHRPWRLRIDSPADQFVWLSKLPDRSWSPGGRIDALPVGLGPDQIVSDREGNVARLGADGTAAWETEIRSLGGIGRAPVFLPQRPDHCLLLTEDGEAWLIDTRDGELTGPWVLGSGPVEGPVPTPEGVLARLKDGRVMYWDERVKPIERQGVDLGDESRHGTTVGLSVLLRAEGARRLLESPWTDWRVELQEEVYRVTREDDPEGGFAVERQGDWSYLAWEAPGPAAPDGRLWISDGGGLAAYSE